MGFVPGEPATVNNLGPFSIAQNARNAQNLSTRYKTGTPQSAAEFGPLVASTALRPIVPARRFSVKPLERFVAAPRGGAPNLHFFGRLKLRPSQRSSLTDVDARGSTDFSTQRDCSLPIHLSVSGSSDSSDSARMSSISAVDSRIGSDSAASTPPARTRQHTYWKSLSTSMAVPSVGWNNAQEPLRSAGTARRQSPGLVQPFVVATVWNAFSSATSTLACVLNPSRRSMSAMCFSQMTTSQ